MAAAARTCPLIAQVTIETTGTMLLGSEIGAALTALEPLGIDLIGLNCATGPAEMSEHLRYLAGTRAIPLSCMPNAGLPVLTARRRPLPADPASSSPTRTRRSPREFGLALVGGCCGTTPEHLRRGGRARARPAARRRAGPGPSRASPRSTSMCRSARTPSFLAIGERTNANGSKAFREAHARRSAATTASRSPGSRPATARTCSTCASTTSAATAPPTCARWPAGSPPPPPCRWCSTPPSRR